MHLRTPLVFILLIGFCLPVAAIDVGELDTNFSDDNDSPGYLFEGAFDLEYEAKAVLLDEKNYAYVASIFQTNGTIPANRLMIAKYTDKGDLDTSFGVQGKVILPTDYEFTGAMKMMWGGWNTPYLYIGFSYNTNTSSDSDIAILTLDPASGLALDFNVFGFDKGGAGHNNDYFADFDLYDYNDNGTHWDIVFVAATVELSPSGSLVDTDFGVAQRYYQGGVYQNNVTGGTPFGTNGKETCFFDQAASGSEDKAVAIALTPDLPDGGLVVGGSAFEGNGAFNDGWNLAFCYFTETGYLMDKWSTYSSTPSVDSREQLADMTLLRYTAGTTINYQLVALSREPEAVGSENMNVVLRKYLPFVTVFPSGSTTVNWEIDTGFGNNGRTEKDFIRPLSNESMNDEGVRLITENGAIGPLYVAANSSWRVNGLKKTLITLMKINDTTGNLMNDFGYKDILNGGQTGYIYHTFNPFHDFVADLAFLPDYKTRYRHGENLVFVGSSRNDGQNATYSFLAHTAGDLIFKSDLD
jgi:hypothetical protein